MELHLGAAIVAEDSRRRTTLGFLRHLLIDPRGRSDAAAPVVAALVCQLRGLLPREVAIPFGWVRAAERRRIPLAASAAAVAELPSFSPEQYTGPPAEWIPPPSTRATEYLLPGPPYALAALEHPTPVPHPPGGEEVPPGLPDWHAPAQVFATDGAVGEATGLAVEPDGQIVGVLVTGRGIFAATRCVPLDRIAAAGETSLTLRMSRHAWLQLPAVAATSTSKARRRATEPAPPDAGTA